MAESSKKLGAVPKKVLKKDEKPKKPVESQSELLVFAKYTNTLPDIPTDPKFLVYPFDPKRFVRYKPSIDHRYRYDLHTEIDGGLDLDLVKILENRARARSRDPSPGPEPFTETLHPADEALLDDDTPLPVILDTKRSRDHARPVSWLHRSQFISTEQTRFQPQLVAEKAECKVGYYINKIFKQVPEYMDRPTQIKTITQTFVDSKVPIVKHHRKEKADLVALEVLPVLPDFEQWKLPFTQVRFLSNPKPAKNYREKAAQALIHVSEKSDEDCGAYFLPTEETLAKLKADKKKQVAYRKGEQYEYTMENLYNYTVKSRHNRSFEDGHVWIVREGGIFYNQFDTTVTLRQQPHLRSQRARRLVVTHRPINQVEKRLYDIKRQSLDGIIEEAEKEVESSDDSASPTI